MPRRLSALNFRSSSDTAGPPSQLKLPCGYLGLYAGAQLGPAVLDLSCGMASGSTWSASISLRIRRQLVSCLPQTPARLAIGATTFSSTLVLN